MNPTVSQSMPAGPHPIVHRAAKATFMPAPPRASVAGRGWIAASAMVFGIFLLGAVVMESSKGDCSGFGSFGCGLADFFAVTSVLAGAVLGGILWAIGAAFRRRERRAYLTR